jgi:hypothetical protein
MLTLETAMEGGDENSMRLPSAPTTFGNTQAMAPLLLAVHWIGVERFLRNSRPKEAREIKFQSAVGSPLEEKLR